MKRPSRHFFLLLLGVLLFQAASTQTIQVGIRGGLLFTNLNISPKPNPYTYPLPDPPFETQIAYQIAVPVELELQGIFSLQSEIIFGQHGAQFEGTTNVVEGNVATVTRHTQGWIRIQNLEIPVLAKIKFGPKNFKVHLLSGPALDLGLSGESRRMQTGKITQMDGTVTSTFMQDNKWTVAFKKDGYDPNDLNESQRAIRRVNMNLHFGAGFDVNIGKTTVFLDGRYLFGLTDLFPEPETPAVSENTTAKSRRIGISAGVLFPLK